MKSIPRHLTALVALSVSSLLAADTQVPGDFPTIQAALDAAANGDRVIISAGAYQESLDYGGKDIELVSATGNQFTILDVAGTTGIAMGPNGSLIGFTVRNGKLPDGGAVMVTGSGSYIAGNIFEGNVAQIRSRTASISILEASPVIERNIFRNNSRPGSGPGFIGFGACVELSRSSSPLITNNIFHDNETVGINAFFPSGDASPVIVNNTIVRTQIGMFLDSFGPATRVIRNNIIADGEFGVSGRGTLVDAWQNNLVHGNTLANFTRVEDPTGTDGNISLDPGFLDAAANDFRISLTSPAVDAGTNMSAPLADFAGNPRPADGDGDGNALTDIGAFEAGSGVGIGAEVEGGLEQECNTTGGALLAVRITTTPENLELSSLTISINGVEVADSSPAEVFFPLGVSELKATATTVDGTELERTEFVSVIDTTPPVITAWFEDRRTGRAIETIKARRMHHMVIRIEAVDLCDPEPEVDSVLGTPVRNGEPLSIQGNRGAVSFNPETLTLKVTSADQAGNSASLTKTLTVEQR